MNPLNPHSTSQSAHSEYFTTAEQPPLPGPTSVPPQTNRHTPPPPRRGGTRSASKGGGVQVVLDETGSWSELANKTSMMPAESLNGLEGNKDKPSGMLGFLSRKKGREKSPKPYVQGVLGKDGARVVVSGGR